MAGSSKTVRLISATMAVSVAGVLSKILGFVRTMAVAAIFGTSAEVDALVVAQNIPGFLFGLIGAAIGTVVIPLFTRKRVTEGEEEAFRMAGSVWNCVLLLAVIVLILGEIAMPFLVRVVAPGFKDEVYNCAILLGRIMMPTVIFIGLRSIAGGMLNSLQVFGLPAFAGPVQNIVIIVAIFTLGDILGIQGLAFGTLVGMAFSLMILWYALKERGFKAGHRINWHLPELKEIAMLALPVAVGSGLGIINGMVDRILASSLPTGNVAAMNYATSLYTLPMVFLGSTLGVVLYPTLAEFSVSKEKTRMVGGISRGLSIGALGVFPLAAGILALAEPLTQVVYERGVFSSDATTLTSGILLMYMIGVPAMSWRDISAKAFYAEGDTRTPLWTGILSVSVNIWVNLNLVGYLGARGLALATSIASWVGAISLMLLWDIKHKDKGYPKLINCNFLWETAKVLLSTLVMFTGVHLFWLKVAQVKLGITPSNLHTLVWLLISVALGATIYFITSWLLKVKEFNFMVNTGKKGARKIKGMVLSLVNR